MSKLVALYARCAQTEQGDTQIKEQLKTLRQFAKKHKYKVVSEFIDKGQGGGHLLRPALTKLREDMAKGNFKTVITSSPDRLSRNVSDYWVLQDLLKQHGINIEYVNPPQQNSAQESFAKLMLEAMGKFYKDRLSEKVKAGIQRSKQSKKTLSVEASGSLSAN